MLNHVTVMGRLVRDPELRRTGSGIAVASFTLAVDRDFKDQSGEHGTDFFENQNGEKRYVTEIVVESAYFGDSKRDDGGNTQSGSYGNYGGYNRPFAPSATSYGRAPAYVQTEFGEIIEDDGDLPF